MATILLVDDDPAVLRMVAALLEKAGHKVMKASNGLEALHVYESYARHIDLLLTDIAMPHMNGLELAARVRWTHPSAAILLMSGALPAGIGELPESYPVVAKPFRAEQLIAAVEEACRGPR
jgi:CheY-like chemotaxis protein